MPSHHATAALLSIAAALAAGVPGAHVTPPARAAHHTDRTAHHTDRTGHHANRTAHHTCGAAHHTARHHRKAHPCKARRPSGRRAVASPPASTATVVQSTADLAQKLAPQPSVTFTATAPQGVPIVRVQDHTRYQTFTGAGAAMTDSSAWLMYEQLPPSTRQALMRELFSASGIHLGFLRIPIGASDFSDAGTPYTYDDQPAGQSDPALNGFTIGHDTAYILPALRDALALNPSLYLEAVPWSPPAWMKANDALDNQHGAGTLLPSAYAPLAQYFVRFLQAYAAAGVPLSAISPENEPGVSVSYPSLSLSEQEEADFVSGSLRPALAAAGLQPDIYGWDLSWGPLSAAADPMVTSARSGEVRGLAWHCYAGSPTFMSGVHADAPNAAQIVDECTTGTGDVWPTPELLIASTRNWASSVALWNLALDEAGGPVQAPNSGCGGCTGVVTVNPSTGTVAFSRDYYQLGQLSKFVARGARRIASPTFVSYTLTPKYQTAVSAGLDDVAFENPDGSKVLYTYNNSPAPITFAVQWQRRYARYSIPAGATTTFTWR